MEFLRKNKTDTVVLVKNKTKNLFIKKNKYTVSLHMIAFHGTIRDSTNKK